MGLLAGAWVGTCGLLNLLAFFVYPPILRGWLAKMNRKSHEKVPLSIILHTSSLFL